MRNHKGTVLIIGAVCALAGCNAAGTGDSSGRSSSVTSVCESRTQTLTDGLWDGEAITAENAREKGIVYCSDGESANTELWNGFLRDVKKSKAASVLLYSDGAFTYVDHYSDTDSGKMMFSVIRKYRDEDILCEDRSLYSCGRITALLTDEGTDYYIGDMLVLSLPSQNTTSRAVPFEYEVFRADSGANVSFPFTGTFSSYSDFDKYYENYDDELNLSEMKESMIAYNNEGGFNDHVTFLRADMEGSDSVVYSVSNVVKGDNKLEIYLKKYIPKDKNSSVAKLQTTVRIPSEYLDDINPEDVSWNIYCEYEI